MSSAGVRVGLSLGLGLGALVAAGCALPANQQTAPVAAPAGADSTASAPSTVAVGGEQSAALASGGRGEDSEGKGGLRRLPFAGRLVSGDAAELPPAVAASLSPDAPISFSYREELSHDEYHLPLWYSFIDPVTYVGAPLGDFGVTAAAELTIARGDRLIGQYAAKVHVSKSYTLYKQPTHREVEEAARAAVRAKIDDELAADDARLSRVAMNLTGAERAP
ncbi:MAG TPA: hypothetical protein VFB15_14255 [Candidatus Binataceae bacterium]|jgi:hypothetical protein|nr:hypothetical protein [Candidatus Binataceae bacterium]